MKLATEPGHDGQVLTLILDDPKGNVLDREMMTQLTGALETEARKPSVKALVFQGRGAHFSFGASVQEHRKETVAEMLGTFHRMLRALVETARPSFALVRGQCLGGGLELASVCHWIFASPEARFGQPEIQLAVFPPAASLVLPHRIGQSAADDLVLSGRSITAEQARELGLVHSVSPEPEQALEAYLAEHILPKSAAALHHAARASRFEMQRSLLGHLEALERLYLDELMATHDANEGIQAFLDKRRPEWQDR